MADIFCPKSGVLIRKSVIGRSGVESKYLSEFQEVEIIGSGGFGVVARSLNKLDQQYYAVKKIPISNDTFDKYGREVIVHAQMDHPNIVRFITSWIEASFEGGIDVDEEFPDEEDRKAPCLYMQLECCTGTLKQSLETQSATPKWFCQILDAIQYMHKKNIIHRDLCLDNVLVKGDSLKVSDFGLAKKLDDDGMLKITGSDGHAVYKAPEMVEGNDGVDARADIFSLGILLFEMFSEFTTDNERYNAIQDLKGDKHIIDPSSAVPQSFRPVIIHMVSKNPENRPFDIADVQDIFTSAIP